MQTSGYGDIESYGEQPSALWNNVPGSKNLSPLIVKIKDLIII